MYNFCNRIIFGAKSCFRANLYFGANSYFGTKSYFRTKKVLADKKIFTTYKRISSTTAGSICKPKESGVFLLEFTLIVPIMLFLIIGGFEMARYIRMYQVTNKLAYELSNAILRQCVNPYGGNTDPTFIAAQQQRTNTLMTSVWQNYMRMAATVVPPNTPFTVQVEMYYAALPAGAAGIAQPAPTPPSGIAWGLSTHVVNDDIKIKDADNNLISNDKGNHIKITDFITGWNWQNNQRNNVDPYTAITTGAVNPADFAIWVGISVVYQPFIQNILGFQILNGVDQVTSESVIY